MSLKDRSDILLKKVISPVLIKIILFSFFTFFFISRAFCFEIAAGTPRNSPEMSLADAVKIAVQNNTAITTAYLDRVVQRFDLKVAEDKFTPKPVLIGTAQKTVTKTNGTRVDDKIANISGIITEILPTGGSLNVTASGNYDKSDGSISRTGLWNFSLIQPLLKGGGVEVATASVRTARISEKINVLSLETLIMDTVTSVITAYRNLLQAANQLEITRQSVERAKELISINRELISAGRMAEVEIIQAQADVSNREFDLLSAENSLDSARLSLIKLLNIDKRTMIVPTEKVGIEPIKLDYEQSKSLALSYRPDYLSSLLDVEISKINLMLAKNNKLWDLSLFGAYGGGETSGQGNSTRNWNAGMSLTIPLRDLTLEQTYITAKVDLEKSQVSLGKLHDNIEIEVQDSVRDVEMKMKQVALAQQSRVLSEKKLEIETEKMKAGRSTNFQLVSYQNDLVNAQNNELSAIITYLNALTALDRTLGTTLEKWNIKIEERN